MVSDGVQRIEYYFRLYILFIIGKIKSDIGKTETVHLANVSHAHHPCNITVGDKIELLVFLAPKIIVPRHQQQIAPGKFFLPV